MGTIKGQGLMWRDLSIQQVEAYLALADAQERLGFLRKHAAGGLPFDDAERVDIVLDLYYYSLQFGIERAFTADKLSVLFSIMKATFLESMREFLPAKASFNYFRDLLLQHSVQRPPFSVGLFALQDVTAITEFASRSFFRHYLLYKYCFTKKTEMAFSTIYTYTLAPTEDMPEGFMQPLSAGEDEQAVLKREEEEALAKLDPLPDVKVTQEDLEAAKVPEEVRDEIVEKVNSKIAEMQQSMQRQMDEQQKALEERIAALQSQVRGT
jgi:hypothetical protein